MQKDHRLNVYENETVIIKGLRRKGSVLIDVLFCGTINVLRFYQNSGEIILDSSID